MPARRLCGLEPAAYRVVFVKRPADDRARQDLAREWTMYQRLASLHGDATRLAPAALAWDGESLTLEALAGCDLHTEVTRAGDIAPGLAASAGRALAGLHGLTPGTALPIARPARRVYIHRPTPAVISGLSAAGIELVRMIQRSPELWGLLDRLGSGTESHLIHGDLRWENVFVVDGGCPAPQVRFVDWEWAGLGDPAWDVGCFVAAAVGAWIDSIPPLPGVDAALLTRLAGLELGTIAAAVQEFLGAYVAHRSLELDAESLRIAAFRVAGVRLVDLAFDATAELEDPVLRHAFYLQVATNILLDPAAAADWLGCGVSDGCGARRGE